MEIRVDRDVLSDAVSWAARSLPSKPSVPILAGLLIRAEGSSVVLSSFDYETSAKITIAAQVDAPGTALVSGKLLADICRSLPNRPVKLKADDSSVELVCGSARFTLQTLPVAEYPSLPQMPEETGVVTADEFAKAVQQVVVAAGRDELLPVFTGVRIEIEDETLSLLATDRYRMALKELPWRPTSTALSGAALVPAKVLNETAKSMTAGESVTINLASAESGDGLIGFAGSGAGGEREMTTRLLDSEFPKLRHLMNVNTLVAVSCKTDELLAAVKRVALVAERNTPLAMFIEDGTIRLQAAAGDQAQGVEAIDAVIELTGDEQAIKAAGFNAHYLQDALQALDAPYVRFSFTTNGKPCLVQGLADLDGEPLADYRHVIMLMRLPS